MPIAERLTDYEHPLIAALRADPGGEAAFWQRMARERTPLVAPDPDNPGHSLVTFVFPIGAETKHVVVNPGFGETADHVMDRMAGTNVCHASYRYRDDVRTSYSFRPDMPLASWLTAADEDWASLREFLLASKPTPDPHHRASFTNRNGEGQPDTITSELVLGAAADQSLSEKRAGVERGRIETHRFRSEVMDNERRVWVYTPPGYDPASGPYPMLVAFDGGSAVSVSPLHRILDNLLAEGRVRPTIVVMIDNATDVSRNDELPCNEAFARCLETELIPWIRGAYAVSHDPADAFVTGVSYGGLASFWMGYRLPHLFGNVIAQSASLWWGPGIDMARSFGAQKYEPEWLTAQYAASPRLPLRIWMEIGLMEPIELMMGTNRRMKAVLGAKGYDLTYAEPPGGHDHALWRGTIATALEQMLAPVN